MDLSTIKKKIIKVEIFLILLLILFLILGYFYNHEVIEYIKGHSLNKYIVIVLTIVFLAFNIYYLVKADNNNSDKFSTRMSNSLKNYSHNSINNLRPLLLIGLSLLIFIESYKEFLEWTTYLQPIYLKYIVASLFVYIFVVMASSGFYTEEDAIESPKEFNHYFISVSIFLVALIFVFSHTTISVLTWSVVAMLFSLYLYLKWIKKRNNNINPEEFYLSSLGEESLKIIFVVLVSLFFVPSLKAIGDDIRQTFYFIITTKDKSNHNYYSIIGHSYHIQKSLRSVNDELEILEKTTNVYNKIKECHLNIKNIRNNVSNYTNSKQIENTIDEYNKLKQNIVEIKSIVIKLYNNDKSNKLSHEFKEIETSVELLEKSICNFDRQYEICNNKR